VTELPIRKWTQDYKEYLEGLIKPEDKAQKAVLVDYKELHTGANVHFELQTAEGAVDETDAPQMAARFKLTSKINLSKPSLAPCPSPPSPPPPPPTYTHKQPPAIQAHQQDQPQ